jgi:alkanesulfonate monooxygenase SsuD/methylene tetrahydromethanopterin reductase-like flavin-dependent oxidoreductase (luciferase family)
MVVPHRPAVLTAKLLSTIDFLSKGRLTLGIGVGWCREEFDAIGATPFADRVVEVSYVEMTPDGLLRHVSYLGEREDKPAPEVRRERPVRCTIV